MLTKLKPKSEFSRNVLTLMTGTTIAQAIPIAISPILTRIYTPEDFGVFALFVAITSIFGSIANGRYELAIMLPRKDEDAINIFALGFIITCFISLILLVLVVLFNDYFTSLLGNKEIALWLYFVPIAVFFTGLFNILNYFNNRKKQYKDLAKANIIKSFVLAIVQLSIGFLKQGATGLISGQIVSNMFANIKLFKNILNDKILISKISRVKVIVLAKRYKGFPKFSISAILANILSSKIVDIFITKFYSLTVLGFYSLAERILSFPAGIIGRSLGQVYFQHSSDEYKENGIIYHSFISTLKKTTIIGVIVFGILFFIVENSFAFIFGEDWRITGVYSQILIFLFFCRFVTSPFTLTPMVINRVMIDFWFQWIMLLLVNFILLFAYLNELSIINFLYLFSIGYGAYYLSYLLFLYLKVKKDYLLLLEKNRLEVK